jgi:hypothetical protein
MRHITGIGAVIKSWKWSLIGPRKKRLRYSCRTQRENLGLKVVALGLDKIVADGKSNQIAECCELHFVHDVFPVAFNCAR